ncbi:tRNA1(Val) (adenine(37)-N6)-methyltransferase [Phocoenobacter skyensis]|uniref:tRNA1(Val) (adenine(37)-N6)-methyltransferase n=1 Tax=Phocoenobacter skyensis TaxID=97481 RepID=A0A1H7WT00_9PAST|nr:methyltransferase [Pasteurella skyensis]MDP8079025.1 methyltransferase [Pasteurella skyensis]MDP8084975.1 methyltransferase [Pasteurella skyensis]MDP8185277.1 methyltransferase [Pasteurella skyensis]QLB23444.1 tRNA (adenosine(37)-N6)-methyltransferase TrmM [Pasteurella skyensis]SEM24168.1 tRNA1Val (adenine37-N6)-methyltransferase [Pasteurella skyensis]
MTKPSGFQFKQFFIAHDKCAMKVSTDSILLGSLADVSNCSSILDIGTGTGLLAIMLAQRTANTGCYITALEIEPNAFQQAVENTQKTIWKDRLSVQHCDFLHFQSVQKFDLIISNPPYFENGLTSQTIERDLARLAIQSHFNWLKCAKNFLSEEGKITFILPFEVAKKLITQVKEIGLYCIEHWGIITKPNSLPKRMIVTFCKKFQQSHRLFLTIYDENYQYTEQYKKITQPFYLNF